jgi:dTDP-4-amino-4,6-dideoxygalactose transaminase/ribosomal protein S18 acetylase RimI-like enzyme
VLIYGAGTAGVLALHEIRNNAALDMKAVGFIDDDPAKRKRILQDVRIFQVEDVEELVRSRMFDEVVVASWKIAEERLQKVVERCAVAGIPVRRFTVAWDDWRDASTERRGNRRPRPEGRRDTGEPMHAPDRSRQSSDGVGGQGRSPEIALPSERPRLAEIRLSSPLEAEPRLTGAVSVLRKVSPEDAHAIARLHRSEIPRGFLSTLGEAFLSRLYGAIAEQEDSCVIVERDDRDEVIGFVTGTLSVGTCYTSVIRQHFFTLGPLVALRLLSFRRILHAVETFLQPVRTGETGAELLSIAVSPEYRGRGAGRRLVGALEEFFTNRDHADRYRVITDASDPRSNAFYSGLGFERRGESVHHGYRMAEYVKPIARGKTLAIEGGRPVRDRPLSPWPIFSAEAVQAAVSVLRSGQVNYWTGEVARRFEQGVAEVSGCKYGVAVANGTLALELALMALGIGPGDEVVVPSRTFIATSSSVVMRGATPIVADVDLDTQNITAAEIERVLTPRTKAVIVVHLCGWPCEMDAILELATRKNLAVIEDCAHAIGATYRGRPVGSLGDVAAFSFCNDKLITTGGEGGMVTTNRRDLWERAWSFKDHGKSYDAMFHRDWPPGFRTVHESFGTNWRMTEMQAAIGNAVLPKLPGWIERRRANAEKLSRRFERIPALRVAEPPEHVAHVYYKYVALVRSECLREGWDRDRIMLAIEAEGIPCRVAICSEIYLEKAFPEELRPPQRMPNARTIGETGLLFQVHPTLTREEIEDTCEAVEKVMSAASL